MNRKTGFLVIALGVILSFGCQQIPPQALTYGSMLMIKRRVLRYAQAHNQLPKTFDELPVIPGYNNEVNDAWGRPIQYLIDGSLQTVRLISYGRDGREGGVGEDTDMIGVFVTKDKDGKWQNELCEWVIDPYSGLGKNGRRSK